MIIEPKKHLDGTFSLSSRQRTSLADRGHDSSAVHHALLKLYERSRQREELPAKENNLPPCPSCGGVDFVPTGNCHACATCGESQGCS